MGRYDSSKGIYCPLNCADTREMSPASVLDAHLATVHCTTYDLATGSTLSQDECDALGLDGRDGTGEYTLANMPHALRGTLWALRGGTLRTVRFAFDETPTFDGITDGSTWNGWLNVKVTPATRDAIVAHFDAQYARDSARAPGRYPATRDDYVSGIDTIPVGDDGLVDLGGGFVTREVED